MILLAYSLACLTFDAWLFSAIMMRISQDGRPRVLAIIRAELRPFALPALLASAVLGAFIAGVSFGEVFANGLSLICWWALRNDKDDDDRWKRRREKLASKVAEVGGRLQVVPAGAQS